MSGYQRLWKLKGSLASLKNYKNISKLNDILGKEIDAACGKLKVLSDTTVGLSRIKEINQLLSKECNKTINKVSRNSYCSLFTLPDSLERKKEQLKRKFIKPQKIKKELLEKLLSNKLPHGFALGATGLSLRESQTGAALEAASKADGVPESIPEPPPLPDVASEALNQLNALGEPTLASLGLGGWTPVGIVQNCLEYVHVTMGLEWWATIALGTLVIRLCLFPLVIIAQRNAARMNNYLPQMQMIQMKLSEARQTGDALNAARYSQELMRFMNEKGLNPLKNMVVPLVQAPIFLSFFMGLRKMANVPVESLRTGGILWFPDLTLPDQYFLLPAITSLTLWVTIEVGADAGRLSSQNMAIMKYVLRGLPLVILPFTLNFPTAILCYWVSTNFISLGQVAFLRIPKVRNYFNIEPLINYTPEQLPTKPKGFTQGIKESWANVKISRELEERRRIDELQFQRAGKGPIQKTYKYDPTKGVPISAKKRD
ncbi:mitochondrial inner membrane protein OXA1L [Anthonomus grandis grandis]|uniref:mitochondrial inner membrane protein OXA1L n=1 Tax=Anthonomus grandis grandis TaxID=2921223 RepID=UPI00216585BC|nr:mitochondrial inner membrane protein OXA1L [Anthonomus grandis grandis]